MASPLPAPKATSRNKTCFTFIFDFMTMCLVKSSSLVSLGVQFDDNFTRWGGMHFTGRRHFVAGLPSFRFICSSWLSSFDKGVPRPIVYLFLESEWETFLNPPHGIRLGVLAIALLFFHVNDAPLPLRRAFWSLFLTRPVFDANGCVGVGHPYVDLFNKLSAVEFESLSEYGAFYCIRDGGSAGNYRDVDFEVYNIWGCRGVYDEGLGGPRRLVSLDVIPAIRGFVLSPELLGITNGLFLQEFTFGNSEVVRICVSDE